MVVDVMTPLMIKHRKGHPFLLENIDIGRRTP